MTWFFKCNNSSVSCNQNPKPSLLSFEHNLGMVWNCVPQMTAVSREQ